MFSDPFKMCRKERERKYHMRMAKKTLRGLAVYAIFIRYVYMPLGVYYGYENIISTQAQIIEGKCWSRGRKTAR